MLGLRFALQNGWKSHYVASRPLPVVAQVEVCSPAHFAGLLEGDRVIRTSGGDVREEIPYAEYGAPGDPGRIRHTGGEPGDEYSVTVVRDGVELEFAMRSISRRSRGMTWPWDGTVAEGTPEEHGCPEGLRGMGTEWADAFIEVAAADQVLGAIDRLRRAGRPTELAWSTFRSFAPEGGRDIARALLDGDAGACRAALLVVLVGHAPATSALAQELPEGSLEEICGARPPNPPAETGRGPAA